MTLSDLERLSEIFNNVKHRAVSLRQLSFLFFTLRQRLAADIMLSTVRYKICKHNILRTNELILMRVDTSGPRGRDVKRSTLGVWRSKFKVTGGRS